MKHKRILAEYWLKHYASEEHSMCTLCGNTGRIDTRGGVIGPNGILYKGKLNYCICPNGRSLNPEDK